MAGLSRAESRGRHVALIRGINVGRAKRVAMADLRDLVAMTKLHALAEAPIR